MTDLQHWHRNTSLLALATSLDHLLITDHHQPMKGRPADPPSPGKRRSKTVARAFKRKQVPAVPSSPEMLLPQAI